MHLEAATVVLLQSCIATPGHDLGSHLCIRLVWQLNLRNRARVLYHKEHMMRCCEALMATTVPVISSRQTLLTGLRDGCER